MIFTDSFRLWRSGPRPWGLTACNIKVLSLASLIALWNASEHPRSAPGADDNVFVVNVVVNTGSIQIEPAQLSAVMARKYNTNIFKKSALFIFALSQALGSR